MMTVYLSPYRRLARLQETMDRLMDETLTSNGHTEREMVLAVDLIAEDESFRINAMVPGLDADDLSIDIINNTVTIQGEFKPENSGDAKYMTSELPQGRFSRVITLPVEVESSKAEANLHNGLLTLHLPKAEAHRPKTIKVNLN